MNINIENVTADLQNIIKYFAVDEFFVIKSGKMHGDVVMAGTNDTPEFFGELDIDDPVLYCRQFLQVTSLQTKLSLLPEIMKSF